VFLGREMASHRDDYSEATARDIDAEIRRIVDEQYAIVRAAIASHRTELDRLAEALLERETLDAEEIAAAIEGRELPVRERVVIPTWAEKQKRQKEQKRPASLFGAPKPAPSA